MDHNLNLSSQLVEFTVEGLIQGSNITSESMTEKNTSFVVAQKQRTGHLGTQDVL